MKLETSDLTSYIKQRHYQTVLSLKQPGLGIVVAGDVAASASFIRAKQRYAGDIGVIVKVATVNSPDQLIDQIKQWNDQADVAGIVVQLPLPNSFDTETAISQISPAKDVDGLRPGSQFEPATAKAIMWILASQSLNIKDLKICVVGQGQLVGAPISQILEASGASVVRCDISTPDLAAETSRADIIISGVGESGLITRSMLKSGATVIDAGTAEANGKLTGDADQALYDDPSVKVTPVPGGVGPVTVAALFDNLLLAVQGHTSRA